eukprot:144186_1
MSTTSVWDDSSTPFRVVLLGGGHTNTQVVKQLQRADFPSHIQLTLVSDFELAFYSGMVPGCVAGLYEPSQLSLPLPDLCEWTGWNFVKGTVSRIDAESRQLEFADAREPVKYDVLCVDVGSRTLGIDLPGVRDHALATRPLSSLVERLRVFEERLKGNKSVRLVVVGGGAAGVEMSMCMQARMADKFEEFDVTCLTGSSELLQSSPECSRARIANIFQQKGIKVRSDAYVSEVRDGEVVLRDGDSVLFDFLVWATGPEAHPFVSRNTSLACSARGWVEIGPTLQSLSHPEVFAVGDCAAFPHLPKGFPPRAGVIAVREGPIILKNLVAFLKGDPLTEYDPQKEFLALLCTGDGQALGTKFGVCFHGAWVWKMKDFIDRKWMEGFSHDSVVGKGAVDFSPNLGGEKIGEIGPMEAAESLKVDDSPGDASAEMAKSCGFGAQWQSLGQMNNNEEFAKDVREAMNVEKTNN